MAVERSPETRCAGCQDASSLGLCLDQILRDLIHRYGLAFCGRRMFHIGHPGEATQGFLTIQACWDLPGTRPRPPYSIRVFESGFCTGLLPCIHTGTRAVVFRLQVFKAKVTRYDLQAYVVLLSRMRCFVSTRRSGVGDYPLFMYEPLLRASSPYLLSILLSANQCWRSFCSASSCRIG